MCVFFASFLAVILLSENGDGTSPGSILLLLLLVFNKDIPDLKKNGIIFILRLAAVENWNLDRLIGSLANWPSH